MVQPTVPKPAPGSQNSIAAQYARAKAIQDAKDANDAAEKRTALEKLEKLQLNKAGKPKSVMQKLNEKKEERFRREWVWVLIFFSWIG